MIKPHCALFLFTLVPLSSCGNSNAVKCNAGFTDCAGMCVDLSGDKDHCGACRTECLTAEFCSSGVCTINCAKGEVDCNGQCVNEQTDGNNCGTCGTICYSGESCLAAVCQPPPVVSTVVPNDGATANADTTVTVTFSEAVSVTAGGITLECPHGSTVATDIDPALPGPALAFTLTPQMSLASGPCTVTVTAADVKDANGLAMLADILTNFDVP